MDLAHHPSTIMQAPDPESTSCHRGRWYSSWSWAAEQTIRQTGNGKKGTLILHLVSTSPLLSTTLKPHLAA